MSKKNLLDAIGDIENDFLEEYSSYVPKKKVYVYPVMKAIAACMALILCAGAVWFWVGNSRTPQGNKDLIADNQSEGGKNDVTASQIPDISEEPKQNAEPEQTIEPEQIIESEQIIEAQQNAEPKQEVSTMKPITAEVETAQPDNQNISVPEENYSFRADNIVNQVVPAPVQTPQSNLDKVQGSTDNSSVSNNQMPDVQIQPGEQLKPDSEEKTDMIQDDELDAEPDIPNKEEQEKPVDADKIMTASGWNKVNSSFTPCNAEIEELNNYRTEHQQEDNTYKEQKVNQYLTANGHPTSYIAGTVVTNKEGNSWNLERLAMAPVSKGWYWFDTMKLRWNEYYVLQRPKEHEEAMSNVMLINGKMTMYVIQTKTEAKSLDEANKMYPESLFNGNLNVTYYNGLPMYLIENSNGETYVRFLIEDTFITIVNKGFDRELLFEMIKNVKQTF